MKQLKLHREILIFVLLLATGAALLPFAIYFVGQNVIGEYAPNAGASDLLDAIWSDLGRLRPAAWTLVLSPYFVVTLLRLSIRKWRSARFQVA